MCIRLYDKQRVHLFQEHRQQVNETIYCFFLYLIYFIITSSRMATSRRPTFLQRSLRKLGIQSKPIDIEFAEANREILLEEGILRIL